MIQRKWIKIEEIQSSSDKKSLSEVKKWIVERKVSKKFVFCQSSLRKTILSSSDFRPQQQTSQLDFSSSLKVIIKSTRIKKSAKCSQKSSKYLICRTEKISIFHPTSFSFLFFFSCFGSLFIAFRLRCVMLPESLLSAICLNECYFSARNFNEIYP